MNCACRAKARLLRRECRSFASRRGGTLPLLRSPDKALLCCQRLLVCRISGGINACLCPACLPESFQSGGACHAPRSLRGGGELRAQSPHKILAALSCGGSHVAACHSGSAHAGACCTKDTRNGIIRGELVRNRLRGNVLPTRAKLGQRRLRLFRRHLARRQGILNALLGSL